MNAHDNFAATEASTGNARGPVLVYGLPLAAPLHDERREEVAPVLNRSFLALHQRFMRHAEPESTNAPSPRVATALRLTREQAAADREAAIRAMLGFRARAIAKGMRLLTFDEINEKIRRMRDGEEP